MTAELIHVQSKLADRQNRPNEPSLGMEEIVTRKIVIADRTNSGIILKFDDGRCAFYSCAFLYSKLSECEELDEADLQW